MSTMGKLSDRPDVPDPRIRAVPESFPFPEGMGDIVVRTRVTRLGPEGFRRAVNKGVEPP